MVDNGLEIIQKRMSLKNLIDQASAKQRDLKNLNDRIEKEKKELQLLEMILKVDRAVDDLSNYPNEFQEGLKKSSRNRLKILYNDMNDEEIDMLYERLRSHN